MRSVDEKRTQKTTPNPYNMGFIDRFLRLVVGGCLLGSVFYLSPVSTVSILGSDVMLMKILPIISIYPILTAWLGWDLFYHLAKFNLSTGIKGDICGDIIDQVKAASHPRTIHTE